MATQRIITTDDPKHPAQVYGWPYFLPSPLAEVLAPTIIDYLDQQLPILLPPYIDPAAEQAVLQYAVQLTGSTMSGPLMLSPLLPTAPSMAATKQYVDTQIATVDAAITGYLPLTGGTLSGPLVLGAGPPTVAAQAANKGYIDSNFLLINGSQPVTGNLRIATPINPSLTLWDTSQSATAGLLLGPADVLYFGNMNGDGTLSSTRATLDNGGSFAAQGNVNAQGNLTAQGNVTAQTGFVVCPQGVFQVAPNFYYRRDSATGSWEWVENGTITCTLDNGGNLSLRQGNASLSALDVGVGGTLTAIGAAAQHRMSNVTVTGTFTASATATVGGTLTVGNSVVATGDVDAGNNINCTDVFARGDVDATNNVYANNIGISGWGVEYSRYGSGVFAFSWDGASLGIIIDGVEVGFITPVVRS